MKTSAVLLFLTLSAVANAGRGFRLGGLFKGKKPSGSIHHQPSKPGFFHGLGQVAKEAVVISTIDAAIRTAIMVPLWAWAKGKKPSDTSGTSRCQYHKMDEASNADTMIQQRCSEDSRKHWEKGTTCQASDSYPTVQLQADSLLTCPSTIAAHETVKLCC